VPAVSQRPIEPGDTFTYRWIADKPGTLWYHCHVNVNEHVGIRGMWGPIVVDPKNPTPLEQRVTKDVIMMLSGWESEFADKFGEGSVPGTVVDFFSINAKAFPTHKDGLPLPEPYAVDTLLFGPGERYDAIIDMNNSGRFIFHDHVDKHVVNGSSYPGGAITIIEYEDTPADDWYVWRDKDYDPDFFYSESLRKGYGMFENPRFKGEPLQQRRRHRKAR